jgi:hypothetical protein
VKGREDVTGKEPWVWEVGNFSSSIFVRLVITKGTRC